MKNTAPRVGAPRGAGGRAVRPPREAQGRKPRARTANPSPPGRDKKCRLPAGIRAGGQGGKPRKPAREGKPPDTLRAAQRASRKKRSVATTAAPTEGRAPQGACPPARRPPPAQEPDKGNRPKRAELHTQPNGRLCYARRRRGQRMNRSKTNEKGGSPLRLDQSGSTDAGHRAAAVRSRPKKPTPTTSTTARHGG